MNMKSDDQVVLLEAISKEIADLKKSVAEAAAVNRFLAIETETRRLAGLVEELTTSSIGASAGNSEDQQRLIDLRQQLDRIALRAAREDNLVRYYMASPKIIFATVLIVAGSFLAGLLAERFGFFERPQLIENPALQ
jgi:hypothetical protein